MHDIDVEAFNFDFETEAQRTQLPITPLVRRPRYVTGSLYAYMYRVVSNTLEVVSSICIHNPGDDILVTEGTQKGHEPSGSLT